VLPPVNGGASRQESVRAGLEACNRIGRTVLVHDAARPFRVAGADQRARSQRACGGAAGVGNARSPTPSRRRLPPSKVKSTQRKKCGDKKKNLVHPLNNNKKTAGIGRAPSTAHRCAVQDAAAFAICGVPRRPPPCHTRRDATISPTTPRLREWAGLKVTTFGRRGGNVKLHYVQTISSAPETAKLALSDVRKPDFGL